MKPILTLILGSCFLILCAAFSLPDSKIVEKIISGGAEEPEKREPVKPTPKEQWPDKETIEETLPRPALREEQVTTREEITKPVKIKPEQGIKPTEIDDTYLDRTVPIIDANTLFTAGYLDDDFEYVARVLEFEEKENSIHAGYEKLVYIDIGKKSNVEIGEKFTIVAKGERVGGSGLFGLGSKGRKIIILGVVEVVSTTDKVSQTRTVRSFGDMSKGDYVIEYEPAIPLRIDPDKPVLSKDITGEIVATKAESTDGLSFGDIIYLSVGAKDGVEVADVFEITSTKDRIDIGKKARKTIPYVRGRAIVISIKRKSSTAFIYKSFDSITVADKVRYIEER